MIRHEAQTELLGYGLSILGASRELEELIARFAEGGSRLLEVDLEYAARKSMWFSEMVSCQKTTDGYMWLRGVHLKPNLLASIWILFPFPAGMFPAPVCKEDRAVLVFAMECTDGEVQQAVAHLARALQEYRDELKKAAGARPLPAPPMYE